MAKGKSGKSKGKAASGTPEQEQAAKLEKDSQKETQQQQETAQEQTEQAVGRTSVEEDIALRTPDAAVEEGVTGAGAEGTVGDDHAVAQRGEGGQAQGLDITAAQAHSKLGAPVAAGEQVMAAPLSVAEQAQAEGEDPAVAHQKHVETMGMLAAAGNLPRDEYATEDLDRKAAAEAAGVDEDQVYDFAVRSGMGSSYVVVVTADGSKHAGKL